MTARTEQTADMIPALLEYIQSITWAMEPTTLQQMLGIVDRHMGGTRLTADEIRAAIDPDGPTGRPDDGPAFRIEDGSAIVPITGMIAKYSRLVNNVSLPRGTSVEALSEDLAAAVADPRANKIVLQVESPGGSANGLADLADMIRNASTVKPVVAHIEDLGASGAYLLASAAQAVYANQTAKVGSIGVYTVLLDSSVRTEQRGLTYHIVRSGPHKGTGHPGIPINDEQLDAVQEIVDGLASVFKASIVSGRADSKSPISAEALDEVADGRLFMAAQARDLGLIDGIATFAQVTHFAVPNPRRTVVAMTQTEGARVSAADIGDAIMTEETVDAARREATEAERTRIAAITKALPGDMYAAVRSKAIEDGLDVLSAKAAGFDVAQERIGELVAELADANTRLAAVATGGEEPIPQDVNDDQAELQAKADAEAKAADPAGRYQTAVDELVKGGIDLGAAHLKMSVDDPEAHAAWIEAQQPAK